MEGVGENFDTGNAYGAEGAVESVEGDKDEEVAVTEDFQGQEQRIQCDDTELES